MSLETQQAIIRHQKRAHHAHQPFWSRLRDTLPHLFNVRVETAEVPFGKCRFVVEELEVVEVVRADANP